MPSNYIHLTHQFKKVGPIGAATSERKKRQLEEALEVLHRLPPYQDALRDRLLFAPNEEARISIPVNEPIDKTFLPGCSDRPSCLIGTDGSQQDIDKNAPMDYILENYGVFKVNQNERVSREIVKTKLRVGEDLYWQNELIDSDYLELIRDARERSLPLTVLRGEPLPCVVLLDGRIELFRQPGDTPGKLRIFNRYIRALQSYCKRHILIAGYVDAPRGRIFLNLLERSLPLIDNKTWQRWDSSPFPDLKDADLFMALLQPGQRSAVLQTQSPSARYFPGQLAVHLFFLMVASSQGPRIARIEVPRFIVQSPDDFQLLHITIAENAKAADGFPYILHRAHEIARITQADKDIIDTRLALELRKYGVTPRTKSRKQELKDLP